MHMHACMPIYMHIYIYIYRKERKRMIEKVARLRLS